MKKIRYGFKVIGIWPLNVKTMDNQITPSIIYIITSTTTSKNEKGEGEEGEGERATYQVTKLVKMNKNRELLHNCLT
jgi:hypothetical protein